MCIEFTIQVPKQNNAHVSFPVGMALPSESFQQRLWSWILPRQDFPVCVRIFFHVCHFFRSSFQTNVRHLSGKKSIHIKISGGTVSGTNQTVPGKMGPGRGANPFVPGTCGARPCRKIVHVSRSGRFKRGVTERGVSRIRVFACKYIVSLRTARPATVLPHKCNIPSLVEGRPCCAWQLFASTMSGCRAMAAWYCCLGCHVNVVTRCLLTPCGNLPYSCLMFFLVDILGIFQTTWEGCDCPKFLAGRAFRQIATLLENDSPIFRQHKMLSVPRFGHFPARKMAAGRERSWIFFSETATAFLTSPKF